jgi:ATP-dependent Lon protease
VRKCLEYALETRRRVKEQLKKIGGMEFYDVHFSYIDLEDMQERFISVPEQGGGGLIPEGRLAPGVLHTVTMGDGGMPGVYRMEIQAMAGGGKAVGVGPRHTRAGARGLRLLQGQRGRVSASIHPTERDFHLHMVELQTAGTPEALTLSSFIVLCSAALGKPVQSQMVVMGDMSLGGTITQASNLAESLQVAFDAGAKRILLPMSSVTDIPSVPGNCSRSFRPASTRIRWMRCSRRWGWSRGLRHFRAGRPLHRPPFPDRPSVAQDLFKVDQRRAPARVSLDNDILGSRRSWIGPVS